MRADTLKIYAPAFVLILLIFSLTYQFVDPAPPSTLIFSAGQKGGAYYANALRYRDFLQQRGITVSVLESAGSVENMQRLQSGQADVAFVQSDIAGNDNPQLQSLGSMYYEPLWVFVRRGLDVHLLRDLKGKHIAIGLDGSGTQALAMRLLNDNGIDTDNTTLMPYDTATAAHALLQGNIDALFLVSAASNQSLQLLQQNDAVHLLSIKRADAYTRRMNALSSVHLPQGVLNLALDIPAQDTQLLASTATLVIQQTLHPALQGLMMQAASAVHHERSMFSGAGTFPTPKGTDLMLSNTATHYYQSGPPFLQRFLPFWAATMVDRLKLMLLPFLALLLPLFKVLPPLYRWRIRSRIYRWYEELGNIDLALAGGFSPALLDDIDRIEMEIRKVNVPLSYAQELYDLRLHLSLVREQLAQQTNRKGTS